MPTTNGHTVETGCVLDNHWGWHNHARMIRVAIDLGFPITDDDQALVDRYDAGDDYDDIDLMEAVAGQGGIMDDAEQWLNEHTPSTCHDCGEPVELTASGAWWVHIGLGRPCETRMADTAQHYLWHWHDGDFHLSPFCGGDDDCADDMCACQS